VGSRWPNAGTLPQPLPVQVSGRMTTPRSPRRGVFVAAARLSPACPTGLLIPDFFNQVHDALRSAPVHSQSATSASWPAFGNFCFDERLMIRPARMSGETRLYGIRS
jgi:hypothetical protein